MENISLLALLAVVSLIIGAVVVPVQGMAMKADGLSPSPTELTTKSVHDGNNSTPQLLSRAELFASVVDGNESGATATLYFVAANGTWYHAARNGTIGASAPHGNTIPNVDTKLENGTSVNATLDIARENRPIYVWKVIQPCKTMAHNASSGDSVTWLRIPGCSERAPPETPTQQPTTPSTSAETSTETTPGTGPGFGIATAVIALSTVVVFIRRQD